MPNLNLQVLPLKNVKESTITIRVYYNDSRIFKIHSLNKNPILSKSKHLKRHRLSKKFEKLNIYSKTSLTIRI